jgi:hypothetical protein
MPTRFSGSIRNLERLIQVEFVGGESLDDAGLAIFDQGGDSIAFKAMEDTKLLVLGDEPSLRRWTSPTSCRSSYGNIQNVRIDLR